MPNKNLITEDSWNERWKRLNRGPRPLRPWRSHQDWLYSRLFKKFIRKGARVIEIGCGGSHWLPYFAKHFNADVWGLDFSSKGLETAQDALRRARYTATLVQADLFNDTQIPTAYFDVVWSAGFIEHFTNTTATIRAMANYAKPGGLIITSVPNLNGVMGRLRRWGNPEAADTHITFTTDTLDAIHRESGLEVVNDAQWFGVFSLTAVNAVRIRRRVSAPVYRMCHRGAEFFQFLVTLPGWLTNIRLESKNFSPNIFGVYRCR